MSDAIELGDVLRLQEGSGAHWLIFARANTGNGFRAECVKEGGEYALGYHNMGWSNRIVPYIERVPPEEWSDELCRRVALLKLGIEGEK